ncbi:hypothetical protein [Hyphococcus luteus]|uniref:Uncharacterized protein n=1 Tax=Hyphococcus luteus TaxID=2058213 RepID=A0A2S7K4V0_9PROT|nr:hypothetical protein [Marinicaulis flavus]PQA87530.1 hypothetical protein CW354_12070 [Marinicaulis flavus]
MGLRIFSVVGESLHFGGRRMETIARVAWLPVLLSMIASMAAVFAMASVIAGQVITFADIPSFASAQQQVGRYAARGFQNNPGAMWTITLASLLAQGILTASIIAPLIRYAGLGEKPAPGIVHAPFGDGELRFLAASLFSLLFVAVLVFGPVALTTFYTLKYIAAALSQTMASFPNPESLHTIEITTVGDAVAESGQSWIYNRIIPLAAAAPLAILFWLFLFFHFAPENRPNAPEPGNAVLRALTTFAVAVLLLAGAYFFFAELMLSRFRENVGFLGYVSSLFDAANLNMTGVLKSLNFTMQAPSARVLFFGVVSFFVMNYISLRLFAYPGVVVCRKSMALGGVFSVTRGWNILRLAVILTLIGLLLFVVQAVVLNAVLLPLVLRSLQVLASATAVSTKLVNSGVTAEWVMPFFVWVWNIIKILVNIVWAFFSFGVTAGLYGRLYRESEAGH